jgi:polyribonucleotide nucleotidyltransferase
VDEETLVQALEFAHREMQPILDLQERMARELGKPKMAWTPPETLPEEEKEALYRLALEKGLSQVLQTASKGERSWALSAFAESLI